MTRKDSGGGDEHRVHREISYACKWRGSLYKANEDEDVKISLIMEIEEGDNRVVQLDKFDQCEVTSIEEEKNWDALQRRRVAIFLLVFYYYVVSI